MKSLKKVGVAALVAALAVTAAAFVACTDPAEEGPQTVEAEQISSCKVEYNWGEVFDGADLAYEVTFPDGTSDYAVDGFTFTRENG